MKNLKIGVRLALGFATMVMLVLVMTGISIVKIQAMKKQVTRLQDVTFTKTLTIDNTIIHIQNVVRNVIKIVADENLQHREIAKNALEEERLIYKTEFKKLEDLEKHPEGKALLEKIRTEIVTLSAIDTEIIKLSFAGKQKEADELNSSKLDPQLKNVFAAFESMKEYQKKLLEQRQREFFVSASSVVTLLICACVVSLLIAISCAWTITSSILLPIKAMVSMLKDIANGNGDLTKRLDVNSKDEFGELSKWFNEFIEKIQGIIIQVSSTTNQLANASDHLDKTATLIANGSSQAAAQVVTVATAGEEMSATSADIATNCQFAAEGSKEASNVALAGAKVVEETIKVMKSITDSVKTSANAVEKLGARSQQIGEIVGTIEDIADQTNLLALNAAIEAARAGEQGRGFAVVADEVRALAERTTRATREISEMIKAIQQETKQAVVVMEQGVISVNNGTQKASDSGRALEEIQEQINNVTAQIHQVATAAEEQTATTSEISNNMQQITFVISETSKGANDSSLAAKKMHDLAEELRKIVSQFKL